MIIKGNKHEKPVRTTLLTTCTNLQSAHVHTQNEEMTSKSKTSIIKYLCRKCGLAKCGLMQLVRLHNFSIIQKLTQMVLKSVQMLRSKSPKPYKIK